MSRAAFQRRLVAQRSSLLLLVLAAAMLSVSACKVLWDGDLNRSERWQLGHVEVGGVEEDVLLDTESGEVWMLRIVPGGEYRWSGPVPFPRRPDRPFHVPTKRAADETREKLKKQYGVAPPTADNVAQRVNSSVPRMIDQHTRLDGAAVGPDSEITYRFTLLGQRSSEWDFSKHEAFCFGEVGDALEKRLCAEVDARALIAKGLVLQFAYFDEDGLICGTSEPSACSDERARKRRSSPNEAAERSAPDENKDR